MSSTVEPTPAMTAHATRPSTTTAAPAARGVRIAVGVACAAVLALLVNTGVAALGSLAPQPVAVGLTFGEYGVASAAGVLLGTVGWTLVRRWAARPRTVLRLLVPLAVAVSFTPDLLLLTGGTSIGNVAALIAMHIVVAAVTVPMLTRVLPV